jgi:hypothetical protein
MNFRLQNGQTRKKRLFSEEIPAMASLDTFQKLTDHPEWLAPRSDLRVFLGEPGAPEANKTTVEPGNVFSPGMRTFGITWWLRFPDTKTFFATETAALDCLKWHFEDGFLPLLHCDVQTNGISVHHSLFQDGHALDQSESVCGQIQITNTGSNEIHIQLFLALRSLGPAGGPVTELKIGQDQRSLWIPSRGLPLFGVDQVPNAAGCGIGDPSPAASQGSVPGDNSISDADGWCFGLFRFDLTLFGGRTWQVHLDCPQQTYGNLSAELPGRAVLRPEQYETRRQAHLQSWQMQLSRIGLQVPDDNFRNAFLAGLQHMLVATVGDQARIAPLAYPLPWLRDSVYIIRCFDLAGLHDLARAATEYCLRNDFFGGFGAEGDAPGQGIWALVQHYRVTRDKGWLEQAFPAIRRKCNWLFRMRRAESPIQIFVDTPVLAFTQAERTSGIICLAARDGLIMGAMDHGVEHAVGWINHWALCGLHEAAFAARELGLIAEAVSYETEASDLKLALVSFSENSANFFKLERTVNSLLWPTRAWDNALPLVTARFNDWWQEFRGADGAYQPEPYWLYFEMAQAHNALLMGQRERAWQVIQYRLDHQDLPGLFGWREGGNGVGTENAVYGVTLINQLHGCHKFESITPHGWSQSEMWLLQRATLVEEWQTGLLLFSGIPAHWLHAGSWIAFRNFPTWYGNITSELLVNDTGRQANITISGVTLGTPLKICLPGQEVETVMTSTVKTLQIKL